MFGLKLSFSKFLFGKPLVADADTSVLLRDDGVVEDLLTSGQVQDGVVTLTDDDGLLDDLLGDGGAVDQILTGDDETDGTETDGVLDDLLAEGGLVDEIAGTAARWTIC